MQIYPLPVNAFRNENSKLWWCVAIGTLTLSVYFLLSLVYFKERLMIDGSYMIFEMCNYKRFPLSQNRYIIWLLDFLPLLAVKFGLPLKTVILAWYLNYFLFHLTCFYVVTLGTKDYVSGWIIVALVAFTNASDFYNMANEMRPGAILIVVLLSVINYWPQAKPLILFLLFFIAFSHLLVTLSAILIAVYACVLYKDTMLNYFAQYKYWLLLFTGFCIARFALATLEPYEQSRLMLSSSAIVDFFNHLNAKYFKATLLFVLTNFFAATASASLLIVYLAFKKMYRYLFLVLAIVIGYLLLWLLYLNPQNSYALSCYNHVAIRYLFPVLFFVIVLFFMHVNIREGYYHVFFILFFAVFLVLRFTTIYTNSAYAVNTVKQFESLIDYAQKANYSKVYIKETATCPHVYKTDFFIASLIYSAIDGKDSAVHVVLPKTDAEINILKEAKDDEFYESSTLVYDHENLNEQYFDLKEDNYQLLPVTMEDCFNSTK